MKNQHWRLIGKRSVFSTQFNENAFSTIPTASIILVVFLNLGFYLGFTGFSLLITRLPFLRRPTSPPTDQASVDVQLKKDSGILDLRNTLERLRLNKKESTAVCFCAAAKGLVVAVPTLDVFYGGLPARERAIISIPLVLYQGKSASSLRLESCYQLTFQPSKLQ